MSEATVRDHQAFIWAVADLLRGDYKQSEYGRVVLPFVVLRRLDCVLEPTKASVLERYEKLAGKVDHIDPVLDRMRARRDQLEATLPIQRVVRPADIAALAVHLMANTAVTGATFVIDGGQQLIER